MLTQRQSTICIIQEWNVTDISTMARHMIKLKSIKQTEIYSGALTLQWQSVSLSNT